MNKQNIAIIYDFDDTLAYGNMQEHSFIPALNMQSSDFWKEVNIWKEKYNMENVLAYMYIMLKKAEENNISIKKDSFTKQGKNIKLFEGVSDWFDRITEYGYSNNIKINHYIISSGLKEMIEGTAIKDKFEKIFASSFMYNVDNIAKWPATAVNYTNKTQFLFRINKGVLNVYDDSINEYMAKNERKTPFENMIYIGDGLTDVPCMKIVKGFNGHSIAVYHNKNSKKVADELKKHQRVDYTAKAIYTQDSEIEKIIKEIIQKIKNR